MSTQELENEALKLSPRDRARLAERLLESLEHLTDEERKTLGGGSCTSRCGVGFGGSTTPVGRSS